MHHCVKTGDPSASKYSACHRNTPTAEREAHASIYLKSTCDGWPHLVEIPTWEAPPTHGVWRCQHILPWSRCSVVYPVGCFMEIILYIKLITSEIIIASLSLHSYEYLRGGGVKRRSNWFSLMQMSHYQMRLTLVVRFEVLSERLFVPSSFQLI